MSAADDVILISGAARSIGRSIAETLARKGFRLALADVAFDEVSAVAAVLSLDGSSAHAYRLDVLSPNETEVVNEAVATELGQPIGLVHNAGIYPDTPALEVSEDDWDRSTFVAPASFKAGGMG
jgi:NAD(P)-dependent dehydrogenase (short-subunit alcohol dehydrogenase family)